MRCFFCLCSILFSLPALGQVKIHDPVVKVLAKPYGVERRIKLSSIDAVHFGPGKTGRLVITLENSGVKEVSLRNPRFRLEVMGAEKKWIGLGTLSTSDITFPVTAEDQSVRRRQVVSLTPALSSTDVTHRLRDAAKCGAKVRLAGTSDLIVKVGDSTDFNKASVKLELGGVAVLGKGFKPTWHRSVGAMPKCGLIK